MSQDQGWLGSLVGGMIRRSVRARFHNVFWLPPAGLPSGPIIFVPNHHGWFDGYLMYTALTRLERPFLDWITEFDAFPLFAKCGGMPFPAKDPARRIKTIRKTIRSMQENGTNLVLFAEGTLHYPPEVWKLGGSLKLVTDKVPGVSVVPVAIVYEHSLHERPEAFVNFGAAISPSANVLQETHCHLESLLIETRLRIREQKAFFEMLAPGTPDVNERWDLRRGRRTPPG